MKNLMIIICSLFLYSAHAQTEQDMVGTWKLVKFTKPNGKEKSIKKEFGTAEVYQVFEENHDFTSKIGNETYPGTWKLTKDNKELQIDSGSGPLKFKVEHLDSEKRIISNGMLGTLEYMKTQ
ncbi:lipocalin family protein [Galbibacter mesophilus]|uniref:lipocalin family protein n=1 Tax=Galbibacter mesophilus TaxID=379069 RepID=UPI00191D2B43|nr:lipocalin family protein [Galbibacter mesophilus]MCM5663605.1 hypothetical protein [Galbibacter mesophilus]